MNPTICLVTRGRSEFLDDCLNGLERCLQTGLAEVLIFDNGSPAEISIKLALWCEKNDVECIHYQENDSRATRVLKEIRNRKLSWVVFPGDDDIFIPDSLAKFHEVIRGRSELSAVAFGMHTIDFSGKNRHFRLKPEYSPFLPKHIALAKSFHEPQFLWPALFFRADLIEFPIPNSRFYFDWWAGQQMILAGKIEVVNEVSVFYRVHSLQESNLADSRRKYFESAYWTLFFIDSTVFSEWLNGLSNLQIIEFWDQLIHLKPIYSDDSFGRQVLIKIAQKIVSLNRGMETLECVIGKLALLSGVYLKDGEVSNLVLVNNQNKDFSKSNISFLTAEGTCQSILRGVSFFTNKSDGLRRFVVSCKHSNSGQVDIEYDCSELVDLQGDQVADLLLVGVANLAVTLGESDFLVTRTERNLIMKFRLFKNSLPGFLKFWVKSFLRRLEDQK